MPEEPVGEAASPKENGIPFSGQPTLDDLIKVHVLARSKTRILFRILGVVFLFANLSRFNRESFRADPLSLVFVGILIGALIVYGGMPAGFGVRRYWRKNKVIRQPVSGVISEDAIALNVEGVSSSRVPWDLLYRYRDSDSYVLVYQGTRQFYCFARRYFSNEDWAAFLQLVARKLPRK